MSDETKKKRPEEPQTTGQLAESPKVMPRKHWYHKAVVTAWMRCSCGGMSYLQGTLKIVAATIKGPPCAHCKHPLNLSELAHVATAGLEAARKMGERN